MTANLALVGTGIIARFHIDALQGSNGTISTVCDTDEEAGSALARRLGATYLRDFEAVLADPAVQAVLIATPNDTHYQLAKAAIEAGKDVFCEKPVSCLCGEPADAGAAAARRGGRLQGGRSAGKHCPVGG
jgi:predicted dehydrogenase